MNHFQSHKLKDFLPLQLFSTIHPSYYIVSSFLSSLSPAGTWNLNPLTENPPPSTQLSPRNPFDKARNKSNPWIANRTSWPTLQSSSDSSSLHPDFLYSSADRPPTDDEVGHPLLLQFLPAVFLLLLMLVVEQDPTYILNKQPGKRNVFPISRQNGRGWCKWWYLCWLGLVYFPLGDQWLNGNRFLMEIPELF